MLLAKIFGKLFNSGYYSPKIFGKLVNSDIVRQNIRKVVNSDIVRQNIRKVVFFTVTQFVESHLMCPTQTLLRKILFFKQKYLLY